MGSDDCRCKKLGLTSTEGTINNDYIRQNLTSSTPMICSMLPGDFTYSGHFIVLTGIDSEGRVVVNDPNSPKTAKTLGYGSTFATNPAYLEI